MRKVILGGVILILVALGVYVFLATPSVFAPQSVPTPTEQVVKEEVEEEPQSQRHTVTTTLFWVGEGAGEENAFISNHESFWMNDWVAAYGGIDDPTNRCGYHPCAFTPKENPFYYALPYGNVAEPHHKNRWIEITYQNKTCYAQWEDVGPFESSDAAYVFGTAEPKNTFNAHAGLDVSPAVWSCLGMRTNDKTTWRFVEAEAVPVGPWKEIVTHSGPNWE